MKMSFFLSFYPARQKAVPVASVAPNWVQGAGKCRLGAEVRTHWCVLIEHLKPVDGFAHVGNSS